MDKLEIQLKKNKLRITAARQCIFKILSQSVHSLSPQEICTQIDKNSKVQADHASVYRNLILFENIGLIHKLQNGKYSLCHHNNEQTKKHIHVVANCSSCGKTYELQEHSPELCQLNNKVKQHIKEFQSLSSMMLVGLCKKCL